MRWWRTLVARLRRRGRTPAELAEEMDAHLSLLASDYQRRGMTPEALGDLTTANFRRLFRKAKA